MIFSEVTIHAIHPNTSESIKLPKHIILSELSEKTEIENRGLCFKQKHPSNLSLP